MTTSPPGELRLARGSVYNLLGQGLPLLAALVAIPILVDALGTARFGVLTLAWVLIGYFSLFDLGLGRALTQLVAGREGQGTPAGALAPGVTWTVLALIAGLGGISALVVALAAPWLVRHVLSIPVPLQGETLTSFYVLAACIPLVVVTAGLVGLLSAFQRFGLLNALRAPMGILAFLGPVAVLPYSRSLVATVGVLAAIRVAAFVAHAMACRSLLPSWSSAPRRLSAVRPFVRLGAWMTVSNVVSPLMLYLDRFVIASLLSVSLVAYYATPYEMVTRLLVVAGAVSAVLFPAFAQAHRGRPAEVERLFARGMTLVGGTLLPVIVLVIVFARAGLTWWLGEDFARFGTPVLQVLAVGVFINALAQVSFALLQGVGRADLTARLHLAELPAYLIGLWMAVSYFGITGAAVAWTLRVTVDAALLHWFARRHLRGGAA